MKCLSLLLLVTLNVSAQGPVYKALEIFKKNQWSVNKVLKKNQLLAKQRADNLENLINKQQSIILALEVILSWCEKKILTSSIQNKLDVVERKYAEVVEKLEQPQVAPKDDIDKLATKVSTIEIRLQKLCKRICIFGVDW